MNYDDAEALGWPWGAQAAKGVVEGPSRVPSRRERPRAQNVTHTMVWRTGASETIGFSCIFCTCAHEAKIGPGQRRAQRYVDCGFLDMGAFFEAMS